MPSGFRFEDSGMENAIDEAHNAHILTFAAAFDYGSVLDIAFPGRLYVDLKLLCVFSMDPNVRALPNSNSSVLSKARYNFAILGERHNTDIRES
jgi:hypothetical protein